MGNTKSEMKKELQFSEFNCNMDYIMAGRIDIIASGFRRCLKDLGYNVTVSSWNEKAENDFYGGEKEKVVFRIERI